MIDQGVNYADEYAKMVTKHPSKYPKTIRDAVKRYKKWKKRKDIWFDIDKANEALDFMESFIRHVNGDLAGELLVLEPWQKFGYSQLYGWQRINEKGKTVRVIREVYWQVPKKNGKTLLAVGGLSYAMYGEGEKGAECYCCASDFGQAQYAAKPYAAAVMNSEVLFENSQIFKGKKDTIEGIVYRFTINGISYTNSFNVMSKSADKIEGSNPYFVLNDELHTQKNMDQYDNFRSAMVNRDQPIMFNISTAGRGSTSVGMRVYKEAKQTLKNDDDDSKLVLIYEPNKGYDWTDRKVWEMVNPNIGVSITMESLEQKFLDAKKSNWSKGEFLAKHLDVFVSSSESYFDLEQIEDCLVEDLGDLIGESCWMGLDLSKTTDLTCVTMNFPLYDDEGSPILKVKQMYFIPDDNLDMREREDNVPYSELVKQGHVILCDGKMIDENMIEEYVKEQMELYNIQQVNYDPAMSAKLIIKFQNLGLDCFGVYQYPNIMNAPIDDAEKLFYKKRIFTDNPLFTYCALNVVMGVNLGGMKAASKSKSTKKIDGFISFIIAHKETMLEMEEINTEDLDDYLDEIYK
ncbi:terminase large subunit [Carnobacterium maltaromaticum]|uniref:terminase large subunit n=1 Tax=Carnobacterium maltaromaticum TaxID=2751 RepID=UPI0039AFB32F